MYIADALSQAYLPEVHDDLNDEVEVMNIETTVTPDEDISS